MIRRARFLVLGEGPLRDDAVEEAIDLVAGIVDLDHLRSAIAVLDRDASSDALAVSIWTHGNTRSEKAEAALVDALERCFARVRVLVDEAEGCASRPDDVP